MATEMIKTHAAFIWSVADLLRGNYKQSEYGKVILPLTVLRRFDAVIAPVKDAMLDKYASVRDTVDNFGPILDRQTDIKGLWNTSKFDLAKLLDDPEHLADNLRAYIAGFSPEVREIIENFDLDTQIAKLDKANLLYLVLGEFVQLDLHPDTVSNLEMGYLYEELIRRFSELSNETAGEHFTPREVIRLMVNLLFIEDDNLLAKPGITKTLFDPACGTGGMLSVAEDHLRQLNPAASLQVYGQELNPETYSVCRSDMMLKGQNAENIVLGNSFSEDGHQGKTFDYLLANPPFGVEWKSVKAEVEAEHNEDGYGGRFGAGLPRINDGSFLFLQHMISKMKRPEDGGSRVAIVFNGSPLFTGAAGSGESEIRRWIIEHDWLEAVVALPDQLFYNTGISTYFWIVTNRKSSKRRGKVQLIDARESFTKMRKSLGDKRKQIADDQIADIVRCYGDFEANDRSKVFRNEDFGFLRITVERPLRVRWEITDEALVDLEKSKPWKKWADSDHGFTASDIYGPNGKLGFWGKTWASGTEMMASLTQNMGGGVPIDVIKQLVKKSTVADPAAEPQVDRKGEPEPDSDLRDNENIPLADADIAVTYEPDATQRLTTPAFRSLIDQYMTDEVLPYVPDSWVEHDKTKIGYEIPLTRHFYTYT
ncbi:N-6 DNA methylase, partial [Ilumatobacter sp.]|uniref:type I restriction-modification system subunit M n=1 Tax=Ilumatobacter sp. TaxID=1967498 RepID=UPI0030984B5A